MGTQVSGYSAYALHRALACGTHYVIKAGTAEKTSPGPPASYLQSSIKCDRGRPMPHFDFREVFETVRTCQTSVIEGQNVRAIAACTGFHGALSCLFLFVDKCDVK